jgi:hypothetical protein
VPPLGLHTVVAKEIGDRLRHPILDGHRGALYLGSTTPDIRVLTRWDRQVTHFFDLTNFGHQDGVAEFLRAQPHLADAHAIPPHMAAFVAGYITHLVMDEIWITQIYRPFFGERSPLGGDCWANILDRAVQFSMDREGRRDPELVAHIVSELARADMGIDLGFVDAETMSRWREITLRVASRPPEWERFRFIASRYLEEAGIETPEAFAQFVKTLPQLVEEAVRYLTPERIRFFLETSVEKGMEAVRAYLC